MAYNELLLKLLDQLIGSGYSDWEAVNEVTIPTKDHNALSTLEDAISHLRELYRQWIAIRKEI